jgi:hypothetical protein
MESLPMAGATDIDNIIKDLRNTFTIQSEMDACIRVIFLLYHTFKGTTNITIEHMRDM